jgi:hypothetical protein
LALWPGAFLNRLSFPQVAQLFNACASSKQFITEFRIDERHYYGESIPGLSGQPLNAWAVTIEVDGTRAGELQQYGSLRHYFCEGNHQARIRFPSGPNSEVVEHEIDFAVSRPSLFHITADPIYSQNQVSITCISEARCGENLAFELSPWEPDDLKLRIFPLAQQ